MPTSMNTLEHAWSHAVNTRKSKWVGPCVAGALLLACASDASDGGTASGGRTSTTTGGTLGAGGNQAAGGATFGGITGSGGRASTAGAANGSGGGPDTAGTSSGGGAGAASANGGRASGGANAAGGASNGGALANGGSRSQGGDANSGGRINAAGGMLGASGAMNGSAPCDIFATGSGQCVAAHSTIRALYGAYNGNLYQVRRASDSTTKDIPVASAGGFADASVQDTFCSGTKCVVTKLYDQSGHGNFLEYQGQGSSVGGQDQPASATTETLNVSGHKVYSLYINPGNSYWRDGHTTGIPTGAAPEGLYMVTSGTHVNSGCCFDYGNSETTRSADGAGAMDAIYFGTSCWFKNCTGTGPWVQADLEYGLFPGGSTSWNSKQVAFTNKYVTAMLKNNGTTRFALKGANAQSGALTTLYDGTLPSGYNPMKKQGAIVLGSGGDCCARNTNQSQGTFYEGAIVTGYPSDSIDDLIQKNIVEAGYGK